MNLETLQQSPAAFRDALLIDSDSGPRRLGEALDDWQRADFQAMDDGWRAAVGQRGEPRYRRAWLERPRGHSKTNDIATSTLWALFASRRRVSGIVAAGDRDQARLLRDAISKLCQLNPWLSRIIEVQANRVVNKHTDSQLDVISGDAPSSYGLTPDFVVADELTHWPKRDLWDSLLSSAAKRANCVLIVIGNAGFVDSWQWETREQVRRDDHWYFSRLERPMASWLSERALAEQERLLPPVAYARLWLNQWASGGGDALDAAAIEAAFHRHLQPTYAADPGVEYVGGLDLGVSRDASALVILGIRKQVRRYEQEFSSHGRIRCCRTQIWRPTRKKKVDLAEVEAALLHAQKAFGLKSVAFDSWQATHMSQRLTLSGLRMREVPPTGQNLQKIATTLLEAFNDRRVMLFENEDLRRDLTKLRVEERSYGFRLVSPRDSTGHGDAASALGLALFAASEVAGKPTKIATAGNFDEPSPFAIDPHVQERRLLWRDMIHRQYRNL